MDQSNRHGRQFVRVVPQANAPVRVDMNGVGIIEVTKAVDIGEGGICIRAAHRFVGSDVNESISFIIYLPLPVNEFFRVEGRIRHIRNEFFGVHFIDLNQKSRALIRRYIESLSTTSPFVNSIRRIFGLSSAL